MVICTMWLVWCTWCVGFLFVVARAEDPVLCDRVRAEDPVLCDRVRAEIQLMDAFRAQVRTLEAIPLLSLCQVWAYKGVDLMEILREENASSNLLATLDRAQARLQRACVYRANELLDLADRYDFSLE